MPVDVLRRVPAWPVCRVLMCSVSYGQAGEGLTPCLPSTFCGVIAVHRGRKFRVVRVPDTPCLSVDPLPDPDSDYDTQSFPACQGVLGKKHADGCTTYGGHDSVLKKRFR